MRRKASGMWRFSALCLLATCTSRPGTSGPSGPGPSSGVALSFKQDGRPAVPDPRPEDRAWQPAGYEPLAPSRSDGQPTFSNSWFQTNVSVWTEVLAPLKGKPGLRYLEVGVFEGQALVWVFENVLTDPSCTGVGIDIFELAGLEARFRENLQRAGIAERVTPRIGFSNVVMRGLEANSFDLIYIDASHIAADVLRDGILAWDLLKPGGVLVFDDYAYTPFRPEELKPKVAIDSFVTAFRDELRVLHSGWQFIIEKQADPCPSECSNLGPYQFHWGNDPESGVLFDPRTRARVPLTPDERMLVEELLRSRPFGSTDVVVRPDGAAGAPLRRLREKLDI